MPEQCNYSALTPITQQPGISNQIDITNTLDNEHNPKLGITAPSCFSIFNFNPIEMLRCSLFGTKKSFSPSGTGVYAPTETEIDIVFSMFPPTS